MRSRMLQRAWQDAARPPLRDQQYGGLFVQSGAPESPQVIKLLKQWLPKLGTLSRRDRESLVVIIDSYLAKRKRGSHLTCPAWAERRADQLQRW